MGRWIVLRFVGGRCFTKQTGKAMSYLFFCVRFSRFTAQDSRCFFLNSGPLLVFTRVPYVAVLRLLCFATSSRILFCLDRFLWTRTCRTAVTRGPRLPRYASGAYFSCPRHHRRRLAPVSSRKGVDSRAKGPLLHLETPGSVWPPPQSGPSRALGDGAGELEAPLLAPSGPPMQFDAADDCFLDDVSTEVG